MSWTCPHCGHEETDEALRFCQGCGEPVSAEAAEERAARLDRKLRLLLVTVGGLWLMLFFIPFGTGGAHAIWSWDLLADREGMAHLVAWPLVLALMFLVLGLVSPLPAWLRHGLLVVIAPVTLGVLFGSDPGGPFAMDMAFLFAGGVPWVLMFAAVGTGLLLRLHVPRSVGARVLLGLGLLLGLIAYLGAAMGESTLIGALLYRLGQGGVVAAIGRLLMLLPLFVLLIACVGFRLPAADRDPVAPWARATGLAMLIYLPGLMLLYGLLLSAAENSIWFFTMFLKLAVYAGGLLACLPIAAAWTADSTRRHLLPRLRRLTED